MARRRSVLRSFRFRLIVAEEYRPLEAVPKLAFAVTWALIIGLLAVQVSINNQMPPPKRGAIHLPAPPHPLALHALSAGDEVATSKALMLWLQSFDNQQGQSISYLELDYEQVVAWLDAILELDDRSHYPMLSAANVYSLVNVPPKLRTLVDFIRERFAANPAKNWRWMASATTTAKNRINDLGLALQLARELRLGTQDMDHVPGWAKQMEVFLLQDLSEYEQSAELVLRMVREGRITDPQEFKLHVDRLEKLLRQDIVEQNMVNKEQLEPLHNKLNLIYEEYLKRSI